MSLKLECDDPWYSLLASGAKEVEGRKGTPKYRNIKAGDLVVFTCGKRGFLAIVRKVDVFKNLDEYLREVTIKKALPGVTDIEEARRIYHQWSTPEEIEAYGFLGIWIDRQATR